MNRKAQKIGRVEIPTKLIKKIMPKKPGPNGPYSEYDWNTKDRYIMVGQIPLTNDAKGLPAFYFCQTVDLQGYIEQNRARRQHRYVEFMNEIQQQY